MKALVCLLFAFCAVGLADETADRTAIDRVIAALNQFPPHPDVFTADADDTDVLAELKKGRRLIYAGSPPCSPASLSDHPAVAISHEVWDESTITLPGMPWVMVMVMRNPTIENRTIRFVTPGVALADAVFTYKDESGNAHTTPLLFVMKKEEEAWKIASIRILR